MIFAKELFYTSLPVLVFLGEIALAYKTGCSRGYCFIVHERSRAIFTQEEAQQWCISNQYQMLDIVDKNVQNSMVEVIQSHQLSGQQFLTNGRRRSSVNWNRLSRASIGNIAVHEQNDTSYAYGYLRLSTSGFDIYASRPAETKEGFICSGVSDCTNGKTINRQCYKAYTESLSWYDARNRCLDAGGDLASFDHIITNAGFSALRGSWINTQYTYWIGFRREWWSWQSSNQDVKYSSWASGYPTNQHDCICPYGNQLLWIDCNCKWHYQFVCIFGNQSYTTISDISSTIIDDSTTFVVKFAPIVDFAPNQLIEARPLTTSSSNYSKVSTTSMTLYTNYMETMTLPMIIGLGVGLPLIAIIVVLSFVITALNKKLDKSSNNKDTSSDSSSGCTTSDSSEQLPRTPGAEKNAYETLPRQSPGIHYEPIRASQNVFFSYEPLPKTNQPQGVDYEPIRASQNVVYCNEPLPKTKQAQGVDYEPIRASQNAAFSYEPLPNTKQTQGVDYEPIRSSENVVNSYQPLPKKGQTQGIDNEPICHSPNGIYERIPDYELLNEDPSLVEQRQ